MDMQHKESIDEKDIEVFRHIYEKHIHHDFSELYWNHVRFIPSEWKSSSFIRIRDFLDDYLTEIFCVRFGFSLLRLRIDPKQFRSITKIPDDEFPQMLERMSDFRIQWIYKERESITTTFFASFVKALLYNRQRQEYILPLMSQRTSLGWEESVRELARRDAHELLARFLTRGVNLPIAKDGENENIADNPDVSVFTSVKWSQSGWTPILVNPDLCSFLYCLQSTPGRTTEIDNETDFYGLKGILCDAFSSSNDTAIEKVDSWLDELQERGIDLASIDVSGNSDNFLPIPHYLLDTNNMYLLMRVLRRYTSLRTANDFFGRTILHKAIESSHYEWILQENNDAIVADNICQRDMCGDTPLHIFLRMKSDPNFVNAIFAKIDLSLAYRLLLQSNQMGVIPIVEAASRCDLEATPVFEVLSRKMRDIEEIKGPILTPFYLSPSCQALQQTIRRGGLLRHIDGLMSHFSTCFAYHFPSCYHSTLCQFLSQRFSVHKNQSVLELALAEKRPDVFDFLIQHYPLALLSTPFYDEGKEVPNQHQPSGSVLGSILIETDSNMSDTETKLRAIKAIMRGVYHCQDDKESGWHPCSCIRLILDSLIQCEDFFTMESLLKDDTFCINYRNAIKTCLADYRDPCDYTTLFCHAVHRVMKQSRGNTYVKSCVGYNVLHLMCKHGANPYSCFSALLWNTSSEFREYEGNVTLKGLVKDYQERHDTEQSENQSILPDSFKDCIRFGLMRYPTYCESDGHTYDLTSIKTWMQRSRTSPITRERIQGVNVLHPNWKIIEEMRSWLQSWSSDCTSSNTETEKKTQKRTKVKRQRTSS
jgi:hypothetical protein